MNQRYRKIMLATALAALAGCAASGGAQNGRSDVAPDKVVYHVNDSGVQAANALRNIGNHLEVNPQARIVVVTHAQGVDFLFDGAKDRNGNPYNIVVEDLKSRGVKFEVCEITLRNRNLKKEQFIQEAEFTPSGVVRIAKLQKDGAAYIKP